MKRMSSSCWLNPNPSPLSNSNSITCVSEYLTGDDNACPASDCKEQLGSDVVFSEATFRRRISDNLASSSNSTYDDTSVVLQHEYSSSKIKAVLEVQSHCKWTSMLDLVEISLNQYCIQYRRLDGTLTLSSRDRAVKDLNTDPKVTVMLTSLKAGNLGLNMIAACHEILLDLWWNPTTKDQAIDRAHRIAQTRPVTVT
ncbi:helicase-like transcription factor CHR27 [Populus trichocarpa]|nr:helicase-like transcription factor CHR27 [Populus trichocarpa]